MCTENMCVGSPTHTVSFYFILSHFNGDHKATQREEEEYEQSVLCGLIKSIKVDNFMNHRSLFVEFGKHINFIVGANGTGKSAILTALIVGLGGKMLATGKEKTTISGLIKKDRPAARVTIDLYNEGMR